MVNDVTGKRRLVRPLSVALCASLLLFGCGKERTGPILVSAIGGPPRIVNPNRDPLDPAATFLLQTAAQSLVRLDSSGQVTPALAQRWIVSDDGLRYTLRLARVEWSGGGRVTAAEVVARLRTAMAPASRNPLKPLLGAIDKIDAMTEDVLEITLKASRPHFLELLAQPELAILRKGQGTGPYRVSPRSDGALRLRLPKDEEVDESDLPRPPDIHLRGERAGLAIARFENGAADLVTGGTAGDLPIARAARPSPAMLRFDPVAGLFGLAFTARGGLTADRQFRDALNMAIDRAGVVAMIGVPGLQPRLSLLPPGLQDAAGPALPAWALQPLADRQASAQRIIAGLGGGSPPHVRVAMPAGPGYRMVFALLRRDWRSIGVEAQAVAINEPADLRFVDAVAPATMASWYLRSFTCEANPVCDAMADAAMEAGRLAPTLAERRDRLGEADRLLADAVPFIPIAAPVRWSLVAPRLTGFQPNAFGRHAADQLIAPRR